MRDALLGLLVFDRDWGVVGTTPAEMLDAGYGSLGRHCPVVLHPTSHEEYALARKERKAGPEYQGFSFDTTASPVSSIQFNTSGKISVTAARELMIPA